MAPTTREKRQGEEIVRHRQPYRLYHRPDTGYFFYKLPEGKWKTTGKSKEHEAHEFVINLLADQNRTPHAHNSKGPAPTLREYAADFFLWDRSGWIRRQHAKGRLFSRGVAKLRRAQLENNLFPAFGDLPLDQFTAMEVETWLVQLELANQTKNHILDTLNIVLREAKREKLIASNPLTVVERMANTYRKRDTLSREGCLSHEIKRSCSRSGDSPSGQRFSIPC